MTLRSFSRRDALRAGSAIVASALATRVVSAAPPAAAVTPALLEAARREGKVVFYTAMDLSVAERMGKAFEAKYPGIAVRVERTGSERLFQRVAQEYDSRIHAADVIDTADASHVLAWKRNGWLEPFVPVDVARHFPPEHRDPEGMFATARALLSVIGYNTNLVKAEDAPRSYTDLLDPKWAGKIVKAHPAYSGTIMTATFQIARELGWDYFEKLAKQRVLQVQSSTDPPKKLALGERAVMADGPDYGVVLQKEAGNPVEVVYPAEGAPMITCPDALFRNAPNPNAARLFLSFVFSADGQQVISDVAQRSLHPNVTVKPGRVPLSAIKVMRDDPAGVEAAAEEIKARYAKLFRV